VALWPVAWGPQVYAYHHLGGGALCDRDQEGLVRAGGDQGAAGPGRRIDRETSDCVRLVTRHVLDVHAAFGGGHERHALRAAVHHHADVELLLDVGALLDEEPPHFLPFGPGLVRLQHHAEDLAGPFAHFTRRFRHLHAAALAAAAGVNLRLHHNSGRAGT